MLKFFITTFITGVVDIGVVAPALIVAGVLLLRRASIGYLLASMMLVFTVTLGPNLTTVCIDFYLCDENVIHISVRVRRM